MLLATSILPEALGIEWGMSREQCLSLMGQTQKGQLRGDGSTVVLVRDSEPMIVLSFDARGKLETTRAVLRQSHHWFADYDPDEVESTWEEYVSYYNHVVQYHSEVLGPPDFSGDDTMEGFPKHVDASIAVYWDHPEGRILIGIDHREQKMPIVIRVACQRTGQVEKTVCRKQQREISLRVTHLEPSALGLKWGSSREQCLAVFGSALRGEAPSMLGGDLTFQDETYNASLWLDEQEGLEQIEVVLYESQWFWDRSMDELVAKDEEYQVYYKDLVELHSKMLGPPDFSGNYKEKGFPHPQYAGQASELTYWDKPEGRFQIGIGQEDRETPVFVKMACYHA